MYKRTEEAIRKNPPPNKTCMCKAQFGNAMYSEDIAFAITTRIDASGAFCIIEYEDMKYEPKIVIGSMQKNAYVGSVEDHAPCVTAACGMGGGQTPMILEQSIAEQEDMNETDKIIEVTKISSSQNSRVINPEGISYAVTNGHKGGMPNIVEPMAVGYTRDNKGKVVKRHLNDLYNTVTTHTGDGGNTDCFIAEPLIIQKFGDRGTDQYSVRDVAHTIPANPMSDRGQLLAEPLKVKQATAKGYVEVPPGSIFDGTYPNSKTRRGRVQDGGKLSPTITSSGEPLNVYEGVQYRGHTYHEGEGLYLYESQDRMHDGLDGVSRTLKASKDDAAVVVNYRIRKLTERECFRLMGVDDDKIDLIKASGVSKTQQYKMAGNSIVVDVLFHTFRKMFVDTDAKREPIQLNLFNE